ncbi:imidazole glycerol phosphate synthase subunit HisH [Candidatus Magnetominusculus dajiuhuensis]|uniref:imidazole glycerol phosphate synthase subunit HisH n=1 Tax=Candidatus Magnetominusculus dajiuhuensis TaxID=3137712 RepID=UPI003B42EBE4
MIAIVDYGMGNLKSVEKGFLKSGVAVKVTERSADILSASGVVLPGVGAFKDCMANLDRLGLIEPILKSIRTGKPFLGICLGLQALFTESEEFGRCPGLGVFKGRVARFPVTTLKVPHMGWNNVKFKNKPPIFDGIEDNRYFYFVHSYYVAPEDPAITAGTTDYGIEFTSMIWKDNVIATQFHPEKSQNSGLEVLRNFGAFVKRN